MNEHFFHFMNGFIDKFYQTFKKYKLHQKVKNIKFRYNFGFFEELAYSKLSLVLREFNSTNYNTVENI